MFTTVRKSLGFIAPVIPNGKHLLQNGSGIAGGVACLRRRFLDQGQTIVQPTRYRIPTIPKYLASSKIWLSRISFLHTQKTD